MARARNIKPGFYKNEDLAECSIWARFIFPGMWMLADREGRLEDRPKRIKGELLPFDNIDVVPLLDELELFGFIKRYEVSGKRFIQITKFLAHQAPHGTEKDSEIPDENGFITVNDRSARGLVTGNSRLEYIGAPLVNGKSDGCGSSNTVIAPLVNGKDAAVRGGVNALIPDSLIPDSKEPPSPSLRSGEPPPAKEKKITFRVWLSRVKGAGEKAISDYTPVFAYAERVGLDQEWLAIAWAKFRERYSDDPSYSAKRYADWRRVFLNAVEGNWLKLWFFRDGRFELSTVGQQADIDTREAA